MWCVGGLDEQYAPRSDAFVLSLSTRSWRVVKNVIPRPRRDGKSVLFRNCIFTFGGRSENPHVQAFDSVFTIEGAPLSLPPRNQPV